MTSDFKRVDDINAVKSRFGVQGGKVLKQTIQSVGGRLDDQMARYMQANPDSKEEEVKKIRELFIIFDEDLSGDLSAEEMVKMYDKLGKHKNLIEVRKEIAKYSGNADTLDLFGFLEMSLGAGASPFLKTLLFFKELEIKNAAEAERARNPRGAFMKDRK
mmetsp:Transcript_39036/g.98386  ORF Transcript_39036/g.98386 Transcript_39036/m.98386 type:complete len:160 (-) Transcript_39036:29-508(-)